MRIFPLLCLAALLPTSVPALSPRFTDGPHVGLVTGGGTVDPSVQIGWQAGYDPSPRTNLQLGYSHHSDYIPAQDLAMLGLPGGSSVALDLSTISFTGRWYAWMGDLTGIYGLAGVQCLLANEDADGVNEAIVRTNSPVRDFSAVVHSEFGLHAGLGVETSLSPNWELFGEYRHQWHDAEVDYTLVTGDPAGVRRAAEVNGRLDYDCDLWRLGVNYRF